MNIKNNIFLINQEFLKRLIIQISQEKLKKKLINKEVLVVKAKLINKIYNLNQIHLFGILTLTMLLNLMNLYSVNIKFYEKYNFFFQLKKFYMKLIVFIICAEIIK